MTIAEQMREITHKAREDKYNANIAKVRDYYEKRILPDIKKLAENGEYQYTVTVPNDINPIAVRKIAEADGFIASRIPKTNTVLIMW